jgi:hypothetical protein
MAVQTIYVYLPNEGTDVWAPVDAEHVRAEIYRILDCRGEDAAVQFGKGMQVRCQLQRLSGDLTTASLVAFEVVA